MSATESEVSVPKTSIVEREMLTVKWWQNSRVKVARFHVNTDDRVVSLDSLYVRENPRSSQFENYYVRDATLDNIDDAVLRLMQAYGYEPAEEVSAE